MLIRLDYLEILLKIEKTDRYFAMRAVLLVEDRQYDTLDGWFEEHRDIRAGWQAKVLVQYREDNRMIKITLVISIGLSECCIDDRYP